MCSAIWEFSGWDLLVVFDWSVWPPFDLVMNDDERPCAKYIFLKSNFGYSPLKPWPINLINKPLLSQNNKKVSFFLKTKASKISFCLNNH